MACRSSSALATPPGITEYKYAGRPGRESMNEEYARLAVEDGSASFNLIRSTAGDAYDTLEAGRCRANCQVIAAVAANKSATRNLVLALLRLCRRRRCRTTLTLESFKCSSMESVISISGGGNEHRRPSRVHAGCQTMQVVESWDAPALKGVV
jgi:hypothetical protein